VGETFDDPAGVESFAGMVRSYGGETAREIRLTRKHVSGWVDDQLQHGYASKTIRNRHSVLSAAMASAVDGPGQEQPREGHTHRGDRTAQHGLPDSRRVRGAVGAHPGSLAGTDDDAGRDRLRIGEAAALRIGDLSLDDDTPSLRVERAWKWTDGKPVEVGAQKIRRGRCTMSLSPEVVAMLRPLVGAAPRSTCSPAPRAGWCATSTTARTAGCPRHTPPGTS